MDALILSFSTGGGHTGGLCEYQSCKETPYLFTEASGGKLIVVCGNNERLYRHLWKEYGDRLILIRKTNQMALYMKACDVFLSKPGGLSSTEAAVAQVPYIHMNPIPGGESKNVKYFSKNGMSIAVHHPLLQLLGALKKLDKPEYVEKMRMAQLNNIPQNARVKICDWLETIVF